MTLMPGFKFSWYYTGLPEESEKTPFLKNSKTQQFIKFTNLVSKVSTNYSNIWGQIKIIKTIFLQKNSNYTCDLKQTILSDALIKENVGRLYEVFDAKNISMQPEKQFSNEKLDQTASMFLYLISCPNSHLDWINFYKDLLSSNNALDLIILTLNRLRKTDNKKEIFNYKKFASRVFNFMTENLYLDHPKLRFFRYPKLTALEAETSKNISTGFKTGESKGTNMIRTVHSVAYNRFAKKSKEIERSLKFIVLTNLSTFVRVFEKKLVWLVFVTF